MLFRSGGRKPATEKTLAKCMRVRGRRSGTEEREKMSETFVPAGGTGTSKETQQSVKSDKKRAKKYYIVNL